MLDEFTYAIFAFTFLLAKVGSQTLSSAPEPAPRARSNRIVLQGEVANPANPPSGCYFHPRCPHALDICRTEPPQLEEITPAHFVSCHRAHELELDGVLESVSPCPSV